MPEGPEVRNITRILNIRLAGANLISIDETSVNKRIKEVACHGKLIIFVLENLWLTCRLGMTGSFVFDKPKSYRAKLVTSIGNLYFVDQRKLGKLEFLSEEELRNKLDKLGVDLLEAALSGGIEDEEWLRIIPTSRKKVCTFLLEQDRICGIGNYLRSEILYDAKIDPFKTLDSLTREELLRLKRSCLKLILKSYMCNGLTIKNYIDPENNKGTFVCKVYRKQRDFLGNKVKSAKVGGRTIYYV